MPALPVHTIKVFLVGSSDQRSPTSHTQPLSTPLRGVNPPTPIALPHMYSIFDGAMDLVRVTVCLSRMPPTIRSA